MHNSFEADKQPVKLIICQEINRKYDFSFLYTLKFDILAAFIFYGDLSCPDLSKHIAYFKAQNITIILKTTAMHALKLGANGVHIENEFENIRGIKKKYPELLLGCGNIKNKQSAMHAAEYGADYLFFGRLGYDKKQEPNAYNKTLCKWWLQIAQIPAILQSGTCADYIKEILLCEPEFIAIDNMLINSFDKEAIIGYIENNIKFGLMG